MIRKLLPRLKKSDLLYRAYTLDYARACHYLAVTNAQREVRFLDALERLHRALVKILGPEKTLITAAGDGALYRWNYPHVVGTLSPCPHTNNTVAIKLTRSGNNGKPGYVIYIWGQDCKNSETGYQNCLKSLRKFVKTHELIPHKPFEMISS